MSFLQNPYAAIVWLLPQLCNSWVIFIILFYIALTITATQTVTGWGQYTSHSIVHPTTIS